MLKKILFILLVIISFFIGKIFEEVFYGKICEECLLNKKQIIESGKNKQEEYIYSSIKKLTKNKCKNKNANLLFEFDNGKIYYEKIDNNYLEINGKEIYSEKIKSNYFICFK